MPTEDQLLALTAQLAALAKAITDKQQVVPRQRPRLTSYDGVVKGLAARQWLLQIKSEVTGSELSDEAALGLARSHLEGRAAIWFHWEDADRPFSVFDSTDRGQTQTFCNRFTEVFIVPGCTTSGFYRFVQRLDMSAEDYVFEKVGSGCGNLVRERLRRYRAGVARGIDSHQVGGLPASVY